MRVVGSNRFRLNPSEKETLDRMARDLHCGGRAMDGGASDGDSSGSLEEIPAEDFKRESRGDRYRMRKRYPMSKNYAPSLYSFAWEQAVQNKPLGFDTMQMTAGVLAAKYASAVKNEKEEACDVIITDCSQDGDSEMEKEEGEIVLRSELVAEETTSHSSEKPENESEKKESDGEGLHGIEDFDKRVGLILEGLDAITVEETLTSFDGACSRLRKSFEDLKPMFTGIESSDRVLHALVQRAFMGIQTIYSALDSVTTQKRKQNIQLLLRLLIHIKNQYSLLLIPELATEMDSVVNSLAFEGRSKEKEHLGGIGNNINNRTVLSKDPGIWSSGSMSLEKPYLDKKAVELHNLELPLPTASRNRVEFSSLLDLHADYVVDSLPSPRRENLPRHPVPKPVGLGMVPPASSQTTAKNEDAEYVASHPYITDALKAVSSYHLKFGSSFFQSSDQLPSPTPSEECVKDDDSREVPSSSIVANVTTANRAAQIPIVISSGNGLLYSAELVGQVSSGSKPAFKPALKCRDPRFKFMNSAVRGPTEGNRGAPDNVLTHGTSNSRKHKTVDEPVAGDHRMKRLRNGFPSTRDMKITSDRREWSEDSSITSDSSSRNQASENFHVGIRKPGTSIVGSGKNPASKSNFSGLNGLNLNPSSNPASIVSLPSLLKAVNPAILTQLLQMEQKRIAAENLQRATASTNVAGIVSNDNGLPGLVSSISSTSLMSKDVGENQQGISQIPPQLASANTRTDIGRIHMKPCDPRHVLHNNVFEKNDAILSEENKIRAIFGSQSCMGCLSAREPAEQAESSISSELFCIPTPSNVSQQLSKNPVHILSNSQQIITTPVVSHSNSVPIINKANQVDAKPTSGELLDSNTSIVISEPSVERVPQSANSWRDVDHHFLAGYNDEEKAAIQIERARRMAEQKVMFAARKLSLVLDLDHTLLNSAKFIEVDPFHEEILRRKEEQDREMPQRHLFRLQHMGLWTKLRPGIWKFLEKASKLYELHLYTMGNRHYATEMAKVLDPTGTLFSGRVMSRGDDDPFDGDERVPKIKDLDGVLGMESAVVIIDDTRRVWPHNKHNLIVVERYTYFPSSRRQFGLPGPSLLEIHHDERLEDGTLASALAVIERLHQIFFSHHSLKDVDVRNILAAEQRKILTGCRIVFSRICPVGEANPHLHPLWQTAEQFGAVCTNQIDEEITHVVANSLGTDKVNWALSTGRFVVHPGWVEASALLYRRANEHDYAVRTMA